MPFFYEDTKQGRTASVREQAKNFLEVYTVLSVGFILLGREVFHLFAGEDFWGSTDLVPIFIASHYLNFLCTFPINYEYYHKKVKVVAAATIASSLFNIALNYLLIQRMGMSGAALATILSHSLQFLIHYVYVSRVLGKGDYPFSVRLWLPYALCYLAVMALVYLLPGAPVLRWGLGAAIGVWELLQVKRRKVLI